ncbi:uncharacterized protein CLUP02_00951 [Colletotrichum lupini]|uniref:Uncharacterized protein n=1 Tax=Colletotrichum lupini TaxID=145971 RepID=A0A9Q8W839_9PEZI|nr:uncharacterized protein CLUP02_00951 [Colletotrichum lupini]UQC74303.1 hypothetical protein CLUP02_00951 [Colletotrichum lupini]
MTFDASSNWKMPRFKAMFSNISLTQLIAFHNRSTPLKSHFANHQQRALIDDYISNLINSTTLNLESDLRVTVVVVVMGGRIMHPPITAPKRGIVAFSRLSRRLSSSLPSAALRARVPNIAQSRGWDGMQVGETHRVRLAAVHATYPHRAPFSHGKRFPPPSLLSSVMSRLYCLVGLARHMRQHNGRHLVISCGLGHQQEYQAVFKITPKFYAWHHITRHVGDLTLPYFAYVRKYPYHLLEFTETARSGAKEVGGGTANDHQFTFRVIPLFLWPYLYNRTGECHLYQSRIQSTVIGQ